MGNDRAKDAYRKGAGAGEKDGRKRPLPRARFLRYRQQKAAARREGFTARSEAAVMGTWILFFFIAFGAKALLAFVMIYLIFPSDRVCNVCDGETLPVRMGAPGRLMQTLLLGRVQRRWCPRCGWEGLTRVTRPPAVPAVAVAGQPTRRR
jgi:hypothetical protein